MAAAKGERWSVVCADYRSEGYRDEASAVRAMEAVEEVGHCRLPHRVERAS